MSGGGAGRGDSEGSAGGETGRSDGERPAEAAAGQHARPEPDGAEEGWRGKVRGHTYTDMYMTHDLHQKPPINFPADSQLIAYMWTLSYW